MNVLRIAISRIRHHKVSSLVTILAIAMTGGLLMSVFVLKDETEKSFRQSTGGFDAVLGARGSKLQLILCSLFHLDSSPGNVKWEDYMAIKKNRAIKHAYPIAIGDNFYGYRIVGTTPKLLTEHSFKVGSKNNITGKVFADGVKEAVIGSVVAKKLSLKIGDTFEPFHGLAFNPNAKHADIFTVVGLLEPTGTPADRVLWVPLSGIQQMSGHDPRFATDVSAVLIKLRGKTGFRLDMMYNRQGNKLTFAWPTASIILDFFKKIQWMDSILKVIAVFVCVICGTCLFAIMYNAINERKRDIAILRVLGARRSTVFGATIMEGGLISFVGAIVGAVLYMIFAWVARSLLFNETGVMIDPYQLRIEFVAIPGVLIIVSIAASIVPAWIAYRTSVDRNLSL